MIARPPHFNCAPLHLSAVKSPAARRARQFVRESWTEGTLDIVEMYYHFYTMIRLLIHEVLALLVVFGLLGGSVAQAAPCVGASPVASAMSVQDHGNSSVRATVIDHRFYARAESSMPCCQSGMSICGKTVRCSLSRSLPQRIAIIPPLSYNRVNYWTSDTILGSQPHEPGLFPPITD